MTVLISSPATDNAPYSPLGLRNSRMVIIAAVTDHYQVNGMPSFYVTGHDSDRDEYVTWLMVWVPQDDGSVKAAYFWGHYFSSSEAGMTPRELALCDMTYRATA